MAFVLLLFSLMANTATKTKKTPANISNGVSVQSPAIQAATTTHKRIFFGYVMLLLITVGATYLVWRSGNRVQQAIQAEANARIEEARNDAATAKEQTQRLENDNLTLSSKVGTLQTEAANAKAAQQQVEIELAKQQRRAATAERSLLQLRESLKARAISEQQREELTKLLRDGPKGPVEIFWIASDSDSYPLALQIEEILKASGWPLLWTVSS